MPVSRPVRARRLRKESLAVTVGGIDIDAFTHKSVDDALEFVDQLTLTETQMRIAQRILKEIREPAGLPAVGGAPVPDPLPQRRHACPAARASASGWPPRSAPP